MTQGTLLWLVCLGSDFGFSAAHLVDVCNVGSDRAVPLITQLRQVHFFQPITE